MTLQQEIEERIRSWRPDGLPAGVVPDWVLFVRESVAVAGPRDHPEARNGLKWCAGLVHAAVAAGTPLVPETLFAPASVNEYVATLGDVKGTANAKASTLRRLHPAIGFGGTTRPAKATAVEAEPTPPVQLVPRPRALLSADAGAAIERFVPTLLPTELWEHIAGVVRWVVRDAVPATPGCATTWCRDVAYLTAWLHTEHRVLVPAAILKASTIEEFLDVLLAHGRLERSVASYASNLHAVRDAHGIPLDVVRRTFPKATVKEPYNAAEVNLRYEQAGRIPSRGRRQFATASLDLMFGVGAKPAEATLATPDDVSVIAAGVMVAMSGRTVPALPAYAAGIARAATAARAAGEPFLIGGQIKNRPNRLNQLLHGTNDRWEVQADSRRARATWLVEVAARPDQIGGLPGLLTIAGLTTLQPFDELIEYINARQLELSDTSFLAAVQSVDGTTEAAS